MDQKKKKEIKIIIPPIMEKVVGVLFVKEQVVRVKYDAKTRYVHMITNTAPFDLTAITGEQ